MIIIPAIDLIDGACVRLTCGDYATSKKVAEDPIETAKSFEAQGAKWLHMVDLDGAKAGKPVNIDLIERVCGETSLNIEVGGGVRSLDTVRRYIDAGAKRVVLGSVAIANPDIVVAAVDEFGAAIAVGIDAKDGRARAEGWTEDSGAHYLELARAMDTAGVSTIIYTDISKDGTLAGPNIEELAKVNEAVRANVIASGGVRDVDDLEKLADVCVHGVICGKSIYEGTLDLREALNFAEQLQPNDYDGRKF